MAKKEFDNQRRAELFPNVQKILNSHPSEENYDLDDIQTIRTVHLDILIDAFVQSVSTTSNKGLIKESILGRFNDMLNDITVMDDDTFNAMDAIQLGREHIELMEANQQLVDSIIVKEKLVE